MPRLSACIEMIFRDLPFTERIAATRAAGLHAVEFWGWRNKDLEAVRAACEEQGVTVATFGIDTGGPLTAAGDIDALMTGVAESLDAAQRLGVTTLLCTTGDEQPGKTRAEQHEMIVAKLQAAAPLLEDAGVTAVLEPLNVLVDHAGYYLVTTAEGLQIVDEVGSPNVKLLFDVYHQQISEGNVLRNLIENLDRIGHVHIADNPGRMEPGTGELNYGVIFRKLDEAGYGGYVGLEYRPSGDPAASLRAVRALAG
ncbi:MAG TPA: TIM barrel protein [Armatimonadota bacterium]|nr:TIM barrel protein [Armatimonadota bacterium]